MTYTLTVTDNGPSKAIGVTLTDTLPEGAMFVSATPSQGNCNGTSVITRSVGALDNGAHAVMTIIVIPTMSGEISNSVSAGSNATESDPINDTVTTKSAGTQQVPSRLSAAAL